MDSSLTAYIALVSVSGVLNLFLCLYAYSRRKHLRGSSIFILYTFAITIYCFAYAIALTSSSMEQMLFWTTIQYIGMPAASPLGLLIVLQFLGVEWNRKKKAALFIIPSISFLLVATNEFHHLFYKSMNVREGMSLPFVDIEIGLWYVVHGIFTFSCMFYAFLSLLIKWRETLRSYRLQLLVLLFGQLVPMTTAFLYLIGATPAGIDPVPLVIWLTSALYIWAIVSSNMFALMPVAKDTLFNNMREGVIVLDDRSRLIDYNSSAQIIFPKLNLSMIGQPLDETWKELTDSSFPISPQKEQALFDFSLEHDNGHATYYQARNSLIRHSNDKIAGSLIMMIDITEQVKLQQELELLAYYDGLTQVYSRTYFFKLASEEYQQALHANKPYSLVLLDIDYFKQINDNFGHDIGDQLLAYVANLLKQALPEPAWLARYGGEEFVISLIGYSSDQAFQLADRLRELLANQPMSIEDHTWNVTASFGLSERSSRHDQSLQQLLIQADQALYEAKRKGRNQVVMHHPN